MTESQPPSSPPTTPGQTPPGEGRQDHFAMRAAAMRPVQEGAASTDTIATGGGNDVPGRETASSVAHADDLGTTAPEPEPIPGAYEANTAMKRQPGAIGGAFNGSDTPSPDPATVMDETVRRELRRDGGMDTHGR